MEKITEGVYEETVTQTIGTGGTARTQEIKNYYLAKPLDDGMIQVQLMDMYKQPLPILEQVERAEFEKRFTYKPGYLDARKSPTQSKVDKAVATGDAHLKRKEYNSAEWEYSKALRLDEDNVRANFGIGKVYLETGETEKAEKVFQKLATIDAVFEDDNKHIFNELGIELRRLGLYDQAVEFYLKALTFAQDDENLYFNAARACFDKHDLNNACMFLGKVFQLVPGHPDGKKLLLAIEKQKGRA